MEANQGTRVLPAKGPAACDTSEQGGMACWGRENTEGLPCGSVGKNPPAEWETWIRTLGWEDPLEKGTDTHSSILA